MFIGVGIDVWFIYVDFGFVFVCGEYILDGEECCIGCLMFGVGVMVGIDEGLGFYGFC